MRPANLCWPLIEGESVAHKDDLSYLDGGKNAPVQQILANADVVAIVIVIFLQHHYSHWQQV